MSKAAKLLLHDLLEEKKRRKRLSKDSFKPHEGQLRVIKSPALEKYLFCGNGFGKTTLLVNAMHWAATGYNPVTDKKGVVPAKIYLVLDDPTKMSQTILPEYMKWHPLEEGQCHKDGKPYVSRITFLNGSEIHVITHEVNLLKLEGVEMSYLFFDEPPPRHVYIGLKRGGRIKGQPLQILMAGTPLYQPWLRTEVYKKWAGGELPDVECFTGETFDNPHLEEDYTERFGKALTEAEKLTRFKGHFADLSGQALAHLWSPAHHILSRDAVAWDSTYPCVLAMDPHSSKPQYAILLGCDMDNRLYVLESFAIKKQARAFIKEIIAKGWFTKYKVIDIVYDSAGNADTTSGEGYRSFGEVVNEELAAHGIGRARATSFDDKNDEDFIERIQEILTVPTEPDNYGQTIPKLRVFEGNRGICTDIEEVQWMMDKRLNSTKPKLDIQNKDWLACLKYGLTSNLYFRKTHARPYRRTRGAYGFGSNKVR